jgi:hypothetical protein
MPDTPSLFQRLRDIEGALIVVEARYLSEIAALTKQRLDVLLALAALQEEEDIAAPQGGIAS